MAIRLRKVKDTWGALCAVEADQKKGDIYLDDNLHHALSCKFAREHTIGWQDEKMNFLMDTQKVRDAEGELDKWLTKNTQSKARKPVSFETADRSGVK